MDESARLMRALNASRPPMRDSVFVLAVLERAEQTRFRTATLRAIMRGAGLAAAGAALLLLLANWAQANPAASMDGALSAAALITLVGAARLVTARLQARAF